jgi:phage terminase large subunit-like protein
VNWTTSCPDWEQRIVSGRSLIPCDPLFPDEAAAALDVFKALRIVDAAGSPTFAEAGADWIFDLVGVIFGAHDAETGKRLIREFFLLTAKKNSKALALDTPIPTPNGWVTMGDIKPGDTVFGANGRPCQVLATSEVFLDHKCFRVRFSNGESVVADAGHLWLTSALVDVHGGGRSSQARRRVRTTQEIADTLYRPHDGARNHSMAMPAPIECPAADLPVAPYTLGAWLGDGHSACGRITVHEDDREIRHGIESDGWPLRFIHNNGSAASTYAIGDGDRSQEARNNSLAARLRRLGVLNDKHIPEAYFRASFDQRLSLLQGLMDTDGCISKNGRVLTFVGKSEKLVRGVSELLSTFGVKNSLAKRPVKCNGVPAGDAYFVQFMAFRDHLPVFRLKRKLDRMRLSGQTSNSARSRSVQIVGAEEVSSVPVKCIMVDSPDHQFLFGRSMLPTHNSTLAAGIMLTALIRNWRLSNELLILAPTIEAAQNSFKPAADMVRADPELDAGAEGFLHIQDHLRTITHLKTKATLKVVAADSATVVGKKAAFILIDELWEFGKKANADAMLREATGGLVSRPEGFVISISTQADAPPAGVFKDKLDYARKVRDGEIEDRKFLPVIYEFPRAMVASEAYLDPANFHITNPNLGRSVSREWLEDEMRKELAKDASTRNTFLAKHLNVEIGLALRSDRWAGADHWQKQAEPGLTLDEILRRSEVLSIGIDGGGLDDLLAICVCGRDRKSAEWLVWGRAWAFTDVLERRKSEAPRLRDLEKTGDLVIVENLGDDVAGIIDVVQQVEATGLLAKIGLDPMGVGMIVDALSEIGIDADRIVGIPQGWRLAGAIKTAERKLADGTLWHCGQELMAWAVGNAKVEPKGNAISITKQAAGTAKIDPLMAMFDAVEIMSRNPDGPEITYRKGQMFGKAA